MLPNMDPKIFSLSAVIVGYLLIDDLTANEQNALGNWLMLVAQVLCTNAFYKQVLSERKIKNSIDKQFKEQREYMDAKFEQILAALRVNEIEHREFREIILLHERKLNFHSARITALEEWKDKFDMGTFSMA